MQVECRLGADAGSMGEVDLGSDEYGLERQRSPLSAGAIEYKHEPSPARADTDRWAIVRMMWEGLSLLPEAT